MYGSTSKKWQRTGERRVEKNDTEEESYAEIREEFKQYNSETIEEEKAKKMQPEQQEEKENSGKKRRG